MTPLYGESENGRTLINIINSTEVWYIKRSHRHIISLRWSPTEYGHYLTFMGNLTWVDAFGKIYPPDPEAVNYAIAYHNMIS